MEKLNLHPTEYDPYFAIYLQRVDSDDLIEGLERGADVLLGFFGSIPEDLLEYRYAENKWTIKEIFQHIIDSERVFAYRALCFARLENETLPTYDEDRYVATSRANERSREELMEEYRSVRMATISLYKSFSDDEMLRMGKAGSGEMSVRAAGFVILGHEAHHCGVIRERYLH